MVLLDRKIGPVGPESAVDMQLAKYSLVAEKACRSHRSEDGREIWTVTVPVAQLPKDFKLGPNARYAKVTNKPAREMIDTLKTDPESFVFKNNGIMVVADSISVKGSDVAISCKEPGADDDSPGHGVLNGGHTYAAIKEALRRAEAGGKDYANVADACVILTIAIGVGEDDVWRISRARNTSEKVPLHALRELAGDWAILKEHLPDQSRALVAFKPNEPGSEDAEYDVTDLVRRLALLNNDMFPAEKGVHPVQAYTSIGTLVRQFSRDQFLQVAPRLSDALQLEERVVECWNNARGQGEGKMAIQRASGVTLENTTLLSGRTIGISLPAPFVLPVVAAFRVFIRNGEWVRPLDELWEKYGERTVQALWDTYKEQGKSSPAVFGRNKGSWAAACDLTKMAAIQMGLLTVD